jgi:hypothetical protein
VLRGEGLKVAAFRNGLFGAMRADPASQQRAESVVLPALWNIAGAG